MVRAAGVPAITYGIEVAGASDTSLLEIRSQIARAAAPEAGGKNPDLTLHTLDGAAGTLDPAFDAHVTPLLRWAQAWWEQWFSGADLELAFQEAAMRLTTCRDSLGARSLVQLPAYSLPWTAWGGISRLPGKLSMIGAWRGSSYKIHLLR